MVDVAITIVNYRSKDDTVACLESLALDLQEANFTYQIVVADTQIPQLHDIINTRFPEVSYVLLPENRGFGGGQNAAMAHVRARYYFLVNPDLVFDRTPHATQALYDFMENNPAVGMVGPSLFNYDGSPQSSCYSFPSLFAQISRRLSLHKRYKRLKVSVDHLLMADFDKSRTAPVDWLMGSALMIRSEAYKQVGGFDERYFMYFEDCDLCRRFWDHGWPVYYHPAVQITHGHRRQSASVPGLKALFVNKLTRTHIKSWIKYFLKWRGHRI